MAVAAAPAPYATPAEHLFDELAYLELLVKRQVVRLRATSLLTEDDFRGLYIADAHVDALLGASEASRDAAASLRALDSLAARYRERIDARTCASGELPLARLERAFDLTPLERDVVVIALAPEIDLQWETLYAYVQNDVTKRRPTVDLALKMLCANAEDRVAARAVFGPGARLAGNRLVRLDADPQDPDPPLIARYLRLEERIADFLLGRLDHEPYEWEEAPRPLAELFLTDALRSSITSVSPAVGEGRLVLFLHGPPGSGKQALAGAVAAEGGRPLLTLDLSASEEPPGAAPRSEAILHDAVLYVESVDRLLGENAPPWRLQFLRDLDQDGLPLVLASESPWDPTLGIFAGRLLSLELDVPPYPVRVGIWDRALAGESIPPAELETIADAFRLGPARIEDAASEAIRVAALRTNGERLTAGDVRAAARAQSSRALHGLAEKVEPVYSWKDIVLPARATQGLRAVCASVKYRHVVHSDWGFDARLGHGRGVNVLFSGPSGTGKTMASQIVARKLGLDMYAIDLSTVVSKYIGETERNLRKIFRAAEWCNAILFFDEADALFGKRSEVRDAHDRYANIEVAFLLQQMEQYGGIVILATNLTKNIDEAFARRMDHAIEFPFPDEEHRERIWHVVFPRETPLADDVDFGFLAQRFELAGGNIRNVALAAAFRAAEAGRAVAMEDLILTTVREIEKLGRLPARADFREYYDLILEEG